MMRLRYQFELIRSIRNFFEAENFLETPTPIAVENPGMETHIHPFQLYSSRTGEIANLFLHTSPEFQLKELLSLHQEEQWDAIYSLSYCFRDEPKSEIHRCQFLMLEWYRLFCHYEKMMQDTEKLITYCYEHLESFKAPVKTHLKSAKMQQATVQELIAEYCGIDILCFLDTQSLKELLLKDYKHIPCPQSSTMLWEDYFFLLFLNEVEPHLKKYPKLLLKEFPAPLAALSTLKSDNPKVCERFEVYVDGVELCNAFNELVDYEEQKRRFHQQSQEKKMTYGYQLPEPKNFYRALKKGLPPCCGNALGVERLLFSLMKIKNPFYN